MKAHQIYHSPGQAHLIMEPGDATRYRLSLIALPFQVTREFDGAFLFYMAIGDNIEVCAALPGDGSSPEWILEHFGKGLGSFASYNAKAYCWFYENLGPRMKALASGHAPVTEGPVSIGWECGFKGQFRREILGIED